MGKNKETKQNKQTISQRFSGGIRKFGNFLNSNYDKGIIGLITLPLRLVAVLVFRLAYGKEWKKELDRYNNMQDSINNAKNNKEKTPEEKKEEREQLFEKASRNEKTVHPTKEEAIESCKEQFQEQTISQIFNDPEKLNEFVKHLDNYLDETFLKNQMNEYDLVVDENNKIRIYEMNRETKENRDLKLVIDKNGVIGRLDQKLTKDDALIYEAFLNFCVKSKIDIEPSPKEISNIIKENAEKLMRESSSEFDIRGKKFLIHKDNEDHITLSDVVQNFNVVDLKQGNEINLLFYNMPMEDINFDELGVKYIDFVKDEMTAEINDFRKTEKAIETKELYDSKSLKEALDYIDQKFGYDGHNLDIYNNRVYFYKQENECTEPVILAMSITKDEVENGETKRKWFTIEPSETNQKLPDDFKHELKEELLNVRRKLFNADIKDMFENTINETGQIEINDQVYDFEKLSENSDIYELSSNGKVVMTYDLSTNYLDHNDNIDFNEDVKEIEQER